MAQDRIYSLPLDQVGSFQFDEQVVEVFPDMISRSVPGYASVIAMTLELAEQFVQPRTTVYDLGCSLGATTLPLAERLPSECRIVAVDTSQAMIAKLSQKLASMQTGCNVQLRLEDLRLTRIEQSSFVIMNYTLQFVPAEERLGIITKIYEGLHPGGVLVLSEKVCFENEREQELLTELHHAFKRAHGYSDLEIAQKRTALENTLIPETVATHHERLSAAGFDGISTWFQCLNFVSMVAIKS